MKPLFIPLSNRKRRERMKGTSRRGILVFLLVAALAAAASIDAGPTAAQCKEQRRVGVNACKRVLIGMSPSSECCRRIRITDLGCVCPVLTKKLAALIGINRAIRLIEGCGRRVPRHFKCGSVTTP